MRRLATRIFLAFFVALLLSGLGAIGLTSWVLSARQESADKELREAARTAADALAKGGRDALIVWARQRSADRSYQQEILLIDELGNELLGRKIPGSEFTPANETDEYSDYDLPAVLLDMPRSTPILVSAEDEPFRLLPVPRRAGLSALRDVPLQLLLLALAVTGLVSVLLARLTGGALETRVPVAVRNRRDEIGRLAVSLDIMADRLGSLIRGQRQLLRDVSHEVRSPLARIRLAAGLMAQRDPAATSAANRIGEEIARLDELIDKILDVSRLESGTTAFDREPLELRSLLEAILVDAHFEAAQLGKTLESRLTDGPLGVIGDRYWISAAIENVVRNALKHTPEGSQVLVTLESARREGTRVAILGVSDTGHGLAESELARVFEPFFRGSKDGDGHAASPRAAGSGLGLAIAARVVQAHGGKIEAMNLRDVDGMAQGLRIILTWPLATDPVA
jgi:signal transduction histidine kinase